MYKALLSLSILLLFSCKTKKEVSSNAPVDQVKPPIETTIGCSTHAIVEDLTGLDGCGLILRLDNGEKWLPTNLADQKVKVEKNNSVYFGYRIIEDGMSNCMAENKMVELTCLQVIGQTGGIKPGKKECVNTLTPMKVEWLKVAYQKHQPSQIIKHPFRKDSWAYLFRNKKGRHLYTCQGNLVCEAKSNEQNDCVDTYLQYLRDGKIVFQDEGPGN